MLPVINKLRYSKDNVRYVQDLTKPVQDGVCGFEDGTKSSWIITVANKIAHWFGAKTISQDNLSTNLRRANAKLNILPDLNTYTPSKIKIHKYNEPIN